MATHFKPSKMDRRLSIIDFKAPKNGNTVVLPTLLTNLQQVTHQSIFEIKFALSDVTITELKVIQ